MLSVLFEDAVKMELGVIVIEGVNLLEDSSSVFKMMRGEFLFVIGGKILRFEVVEFFHSPSTEKEVILLLLFMSVGLTVLTLLFRVVDLTESIAPPDVEVIGVVLAVGFVFHGAFIVEGNVLEIDIAPYGVLFVHDFNLFGLFTVFQILMGVPNPQIVFILHLFLLEFLIDIFLLFFVTVNVFLICFTGYFLLI